MVVGDVELAVQRDVRETEVARQQEGVPVGVADLAVGRAALRHWNFSSGNAVVLLESQFLQVRLAHDRSQLFIGFRSTERDGEKSWFSIDVVRTLITGERRDVAVLDEENSRFLREHLEEIEGRFAADQIDHSEEQLRNLERERAKRIFVS